jgi:hypothetical protein
MKLTLVSKQEGEGVERHRSSRVFRAPHFLANRQRVLIEWSRLRAQCLYAARVMASNSVIRLVLL